MKIKVSATRMQLMALKKRLKLAKKGHKLLKDKQDQLVREFFNVIYVYRDLREKVEQSLMKAYSSMIIARSVMNDEVIDNAFLIPSKSVKLEANYKNVMSVKVPRFNVKFEGKPGLQYSPISTSVELDIASKTFEEIAEDLIKLAEIEKEVIEIAKEIEITRRRVNALEYVLMPELESAIKYISMKIGEMERSNLSRLMKIKDIVRAK
jgi:V/A-type H+-transporting ATPase subunit D